MGSFVSWLDHSEDDQRRVREMLQLFSDKDTVDDLGIGTVRDAISNTLFPGTSIIQTRARYFLFIPWVFRYAEQRHPQQVVAKATDAERNLIGALINGDDHDGLIGSQAGRNVRTLPSAIFWGGLIRYGVFLAPSLSIRQYGRHVARGVGLPDTEDEIADRSATFWQRDIPDPPPDFFRFDSANFDLTHEEAEWLTERILSADSPHDVSLLSAYVRDLRRGAPAPQADALWSAALPTDTPPAMKTLVHHAERFSCAIHGAALVYNLMLAEERPTSVESSDGTSPETYRLWLDDWAAQATAVHLATWASQPAAFWDCVLSHTARVPPATRVFIDAWLALVADRPRNLGPFVDARELIRAREIQHKRAQARLANKSAWQSGADSPGRVRSSSAGRRSSGCCVTSPAAWGRRGSRMLSPDDRTLLVDLLAPPGPGCRLERAIGTTFTLHLTALLPVPLGLAGADLSRSTDPLGVLQSVRTYADRIDLFCQAGHVLVPSQRNDLLAFLEPMVHQVRAPRPGHLFHPKLWVLRYINDEDGDERFRLVCGSRNLTHERAWDVVISLDGRRTLQRHAVNRPVADFLTSLPARVPAGIPRERIEGIEALAEAMRFVEWERPDDAVLGSHWLTFHVFGAGRRTRPDMSGYRRLVVSPFVNDEGLDAVWPDGAGDCVVVSRAEQLDAVGEDWRNWLRDHATLRVLDEAAAIPDSESDEAGLRWSLSGLHAKLYVVERSKAAHVFIGSANTTDAAWGGNDELLVEVVGKVGTYGVEATVGSETATTASGFGRILLPHILGEPVEEAPDAELRRRLENALRGLAALTYTATVEGDHEAPLLWVRSDEPLRVPGELPPDLDVTIELLTLSGQPHRPALGGRLDHRWQLSQVEEITPFLVVRLGTGTGSARVEVGSVVLARLVGDPLDRLDRVLARRIGTPSEFLRFLLLLLQLAGREGWFPEGAGGGLVGAFAGGDGTAGLLEAVLSALASAPNAVDDIDRLVKRLTATEQGRQVLPPGWNDFWPSVIEARSRLRASS